MNRVLFGLLGYPLSFTLSPTMHNAAFAALNLPYHYLSLPVSPRDLPRTIESLRILPFRGANVTTPFKERAIPELDTLRGDGKLLETVNWLAVKGGRIIGDNTDAVGIEAAIRARVGRSGLQAIRRLGAVLVGAGGAARAVALALRRVGVETLWVENRTAVRASRLAAFCRDRLGYEEVRTGGGQRGGILVSAVPPSAYPTRWWRGCLLATSPMVVCELAYGPRATPLERAIRDEVWISGRAVLLHQGFRSFERWIGRPAPRLAMHRALHQNSSERRAIIRFA